MAVTKRKGAARTVDTTNVPLSDRPGVPDTAGMEQDKLTAGSSEDIEASGAIMEPTIKERIDVDHPAVDNEPRKDSTVSMNQIDFNEPSALKSPEDQVEEDLKDGGNA